MGVSRRQFTQGEEDLLNSSHRPVVAEDFPTEVALGTNNALPDIWRLTPRNDPLRGDELPTRPPEDLRNFCRILTFCR
jgi:hypothetical protein